MGEEERHPVRRKWLVESTTPRHGEKQERLKPTLQGEGKKKDLLLKGNSDPTGTRGRWGGGGKVSQKVYVADHVDGDRTEENLYASKSRGDRMLGAGGGKTVGYGRRLNFLNVQVDPQKKRLKFVAAFAQAEKAGMRKKRCSWCSGHTIGKRGLLRKTSDSSGPCPKEDLRGVGHLNPQRVKDRDGTATNEKGRGWGEEDSSLLSRSIRELGKMD